MAGEAVDSPIETSLKNDRFTQDIREAWDAQYAALNLTSEEYAELRSYACTNIGEYLDKLNTACDNHQGARRKIAQWFQPFFESIDGFIPAAMFTLQAWPNPGSLVLGGIVGIIHVTRQYTDYQKRTLQLLKRMCGKAELLLEFESSVYRNNLGVQKAVIEVYGSILAFCVRAFRFVTKERTRIRGKGLAIFRSYELRFGDIEQSFEDRLERVQGQAANVDRQRLADMHRSRDNQQKMMIQAFDQIGELRADMAKRDDDMSQRLDLMRRQNELEQKRKHVEEKKKLLNWLSPPGFRDLYEKLCAEHLGGTGSWFLRSEAYANWKASDQSTLLWVKGKPGSGKSVLAAVTTANLSPDSEVDMPFAYAFCRRSGENQEQPQDPSTIMGTLMRQLCEQQPTIDPALVREYSKGGAKPTGPTVQRIADSILSNLPAVTLAIDALDELKCKDELALSLVKFIEERPGICVKIIVFSREDHKIDEHFAPFQHVQLDQGANDDHVKAYIENCFPDDDEDDTTAEIREECFKKADGMFLWVKLMKESLGGPMSKTERLKRIKAQPPGLDTRYDQVLQNIWNQGNYLWETAVMVLIWVTHACTPLTASQMLEAVIDYKTVTTVKEASASMFPSAKKLVAVCANLVFTDRDGHVRLCHESVRDYLDTVRENTTEPLARYRERVLSAQAYLAETCVNYLLLEDFQRGPSSSLRLVIMEQQHPFLRYAAKFWGSHASGKDMSQLQTRILELVSSLPCRELTLQTVHVDVSEDQWNGKRQSNPLHVVSLFGLVWIAEALPNAETLVAQTNEMGATPLLYAVLSNHQAMALWLIERLQGPQKLLISTTRQVSVIHLAAGLGWAHVIKELLRNDSTLVSSHEATTGATPLVTACSVAEGQSSAALETAATLINHNADVNDLHEPSASALMWATWLRHSALIDLLLQHGAEPDRRDSLGFTALHYAAQIENPSIAEALLRKGADPKATTLNGLGYTPLHVAARSQTLKVIDLLHRAHPDLDMKSRNGSTALHIAAIHDSAEAAKSLLRLGASKDVVDADGQTALFAAAQAGALEVLVVLVHAGCDIRLRTSDGQTVIHAAARSGKYDALRTIMRNQTSHDWQPLLSMTSNEGETAVHAAVRGGSVQVVRRLLRSHAVATTCDQDGFTPLHYATSFGHKNMLRELLEYTRDANPRNNDGNTPLHSAAVDGNVTLFRQYFEHCSKLGLSVDFDAQNSSGRTPFTLTLINRHRDAARLLLDKKPASLPDDTGSYPIHYAASLGYDPVVQAMLGQEGASVQDSIGRTAMSWAALCGQTSTLGLLVASQPELVDVPDETGATPLLLALFGKHLDCAHCLIDSEAACNKADENGQTALHVAADIGDVPMVQRLLRKGCHVDALDRWSATPFHRAVGANKVEVIPVLVAAGFTAFDKTTFLGNSGVLIASENGSLDMLRLLVEYGAQLADRNYLGRTAVHYAAECGSIDILDFLSQHREALNVSDTERYTPLLLAASAGCPETVRYLIRVSEPDIDQSNTWDCETPLLAAAKRGYPLTVRCLLDAGADPHRRDTFGRSSLDYAACDEATMREFEAKKFTVTQVSTENQRDELVSTISRCCNALLSCLSEMSATDQWARLNAVDTLSVALQFAEDYDAATVCFREIYLPLEMTLMRAGYICEFCGAIEFAGDKYICKSCCCPTAIICTICHEDYIAAGRSPPTSLTELVKLEKLVQPVRVASEGLSVLTTIESILRLDGREQWFLRVRDQYETWEKKYNSASRFQDLRRPGFQYLKLLTEAEPLLIKLQATSVIPFGPEDLQSLQVLDEEYRAHQTKYPPSKEIVDPRCKDHQFLRVSADGDGRTTDAESDNRKVSKSFAKEVLDKYSGKPIRHNPALDGRVKEPSEVYDKDNPRLSTEPAHDAEKLVATTGGSSGLGRSGTEARASFREPSAIPTGSKLAFEPPLRTTTLGPHDLLAAGHLNRPRRSSTLPLPATVDEVLRLGRSSTSRPPMSQQVDSDNGSRKLELPTTGTGQATDRAVISMPVKTQQISLASRAKTYPGLTTDVAAVNPTFSELMPMLDVTLSNEPDSLEVPPASEVNDSLTSSQTVQPKDLVILDLQNSLESLPHPMESYRRFLRIAHAMPHVAGWTYDFILEWTYALSIRDSIAPGFANDFIRGVRESRDYIDGGVIPAPQTYAINDDDDGSNDENDSNSDDE